MSFKLPDLPYAHDALAPYMSRETLEYHHDKHHKAYVDNGNKLLEGSGLENKSLEEVVKGSFGKNAGLFNNAGQHYNHIAFLEMDEAEWRRRQDSGKAQGQDRQRPRRRCQDERRFHAGRRDAVRLRLGLARGQGRQADRQQDAEWRKSARSRGNADSRLRRMGALLLHRLPQSPARLSQGLPGSPGELGARRRNVRRGDASRPSAEGRTSRDFRTRPALRSANLFADRLALVVLAAVAVIAAADVPRLRPGLG